MSLVVNHNLMAQNTARNLNTHYSRLAANTQKLSSGLRINSAADDAAGLAIRELMRADISALQQGARNANDAISMLQVADGALSVIDEKLIRLKELAEQAATGTYTSTQRIIIQSEYQAMLDEIDRIANATDFNGIKLLDGSREGEHDGTGLEAKGAMKIHFGSMNDSAEDYYYISIGNCTSQALGLGNTTIYPKTEMTFTPKASYPEFLDPETGIKYYFDGDFYFTNPNKPAETSLDWETNEIIIKRLRTQQVKTTSNVIYNVYQDLNGHKYYTQNYQTYTSDPNDPNKMLDPVKDKALIENLQPISGERVLISTTWLVYEAPDKSNWYSSDNGLSFVPDIQKPAENVKLSSKSEDKTLIASLSPVQEQQEILRPSVLRPFTIWQYPDEPNSILYSLDDGQSFVRSPHDESSVIPTDQIKTTPIRKPETESAYITYEIYTDDANVRYYTSDKGKTFIKNTKNPADVTYKLPDNAAEIAALKASPYKQDGSTTYTVFVDPNDNKTYYSQDNGNSFFSILSDPTGSAIKAGDADYDNLKASLQKVDSTVSSIISFTAYINPDDNRDYWTSDGGNTWVADINDGNIVFNADNPADEEQIKKLLANPKPATLIDGRKDYTIWKDPNNGKLYYAPLNVDPPVFYGKIVPEQDALDPIGQKDIQDRLQQELVPVQNALIYLQMPDEYLVYEDTKSGTLYYSADGGKSFTSNPLNPYDQNSYLTDKDILENLQPKSTATEAQITLGPGGSISTQQAAQEALIAINKAIVSKDKIRAHLGALQNRLENTITNVNIQAENLQMAESRISDMDVATEMTDFVRNQILAQSAVAMLAQANSLPQMAIQLMS